MGFERFTERARQVIVFSQEEARDLRTEITPECIFLGLIREGEGLGAEVLAHFGFTAENVRQHCERGQRENGTGRQIPFTSGATRVTEGALREALSLGHNYIGTEHLLLALERTPSPAVAEWLNPFDVRSAVIRRVSGGPKAKDPVPTTLVTAHFPRSLAIYVLELLGERPLSDAEAREAYLLLERALG